MVDVKGARTYSSPLRKQQAAATRRAVLAAARDLFVAQGYAATTVDQIAERAGVSKPTVFNAVGNKQMLLRTVRDVALAGDDRPIPVSQRPLAAKIGEEPDRRRAIELLATHLTTAASRYAPVYEVLRAAADSGEPDLRALWETEEEQRLAGARHWIDVLRRKGNSNPPGFDVRSAVDVLWLLMASDNFSRLVYRRGWSEARYRRWLIAAISALFPSDGG